MPLLNLIKLFSIHGMCVQWMVVIKKTHVCQWMVVIKKNSVCQVLSVWLTVEQGVA